MGSYMKNRMESYMKRRIVSLAATAVVVGAGIFAVAGGLTAAASASSAASGLPTLTLATNGRSITVGGTLQSGAVNVVSTVTKEGQGDPALIRLDPGVSFAAARAAVKGHGGDFNNLDPLGALVFFTTVNKGASNSVQTSLQPGNYVALDANGSHKDVHALFTVTQAAHPASLPAPKATLQSIEFGFLGPGTLHDGELVRFENSGFLVHMIIAIGVKNAKTAAKVTTLLKAGKDNQAGNLSTSFLTFDGGLSPGQMQQQVLTAKPGIYVLACFMDTQDGREHTQLGMERTIRIAK
jgi:hypothetical protein